MEYCPMCDGGRKKVKDRSKEIVCPMCSGSGSITEEQKQNFFYDLLNRKGMIVTRKGRR